MSKHRQRVEKLEQNATELRIIFVAPTKTEQQALGYIRLFTDHRAVPEEHCSFIGARRMERSSRGARRWLPPHP